MNDQTKVWGIHMGAHVGSRPIDENYIAIGWQELGDLRQYSDREAYKNALAEHYPEKKEGSRPVDAGILYRFTYLMEKNQFVVYPSKQDRMVNIGRFTGEIEHVSDDPDEYPNRRGVEWLGHFPRNDFPQSALNEIGAFITVFLIKKHRQEFLTKAGVIKPVAEEDAPKDEMDANEAYDALESDDDTAAVAVSRQAETTTGDFVIRRIMGGMSGYEFEEFVAHLLECMGYTARVTKRSGDGGVDVIAHMDALGFQPPIVKVQCKRKIGQTPRPEVDQLLGTLGDGEYGLFINLGSFSRESGELERNRAKLRLINGEQFVELILENFDKLAPRYRSLIPLKQIYVPDLQNADH
ncbi:MAG: restriction endonuclease [Loktanella sp.]|nr:restriction endonuclease [Loktanella sp.]